MTPYLNHITLTTGRLKRCHLEDVNGLSNTIITIWLRCCVASPQAMRLPISSLETYTAKALVSRGTLYVTIYAQGTAWITMGVATRTKHGEETWASLIGHFGGHPSAIKPSEPWCGVVLHEKSAADANIHRWMEAFEKAVAFAWIQNRKLIIGKEES